MKEKKRGEIMDNLRVLYAKIFENLYEKFLLSMLVDNQIDTRFKAIHWITKVSSELSIIMDN